MSVTEAPFPPYPECRVQHQGQARQADVAGSTDPIRRYQGTAELIGTSGSAPPEAAGLPLEDNYVRTLLGEQMKAVLVAAISAGNDLSLTLLVEANLLFNNDGMSADKHARVTGNNTVLRSIWRLVEDLSAMVGLEWPAVERKVKIEYLLSLVTTSRNGADMQANLPPVATRGESADCSYFDPVRSTSFWLDFHAIQPT